MQVVQVLLSTKVMPLSNPPMGGTPNNVWSAKVILVSELNTHTHTHTQMFPRLTF